jgi:putative Mg2+ transporter-C (MgtC) family protein
MTPELKLQLFRETEFLLRLVLAGVFSAALGWERERAGKPAGFRTHIVVGVAAALFVTVGILAVAEHPAAIMNLDPTRTVHAIAVGIGFLGGGVVFVSRRRDRVEGLTTAASVWATAGVGAAAGYGLYVVATGATVMLLIVLHMLKDLDRSSDAIADSAAEQDARGIGEGGPGRHDE